MKAQTTKILATSIAGAFLASMTASGAVWTGAGVGDEFSTPANWDDNTAPTGGTSTTATRDINTVVTVERLVNSTAGRTFVDGGATMNVTGGTHSDNRSGGTIRNFFGRGSAGTVNQTGGSYNVGHMVSIGGGGSGGNGTYNLSGGDLIISRGSNSIIDGAFPSQSLEVSDEENAGSALFEISGGSLTTRVGAAVGQTGTFSVVGSGATGINLGSNGSIDGAWRQKGGGTLSMTVDLGGVTPIFIDDVDGGGVVANFDSGSLLNLGFDGIAPVNGTWILMEAENSAISDLGLGLTGATDSNWSFAVDNTGPNGLLSATYIPEPSAALLLGASLLGLGMRRRRS